MNEKNRTAHFNNLIEVLRETKTFYMPYAEHKCGAPACIAGHCEAHFGRDLEEYLDVNCYVYDWLIEGGFSRKNWADITQEEAITALEMVRDRKVPDNPYSHPTFTID